MKDEKGMTPLAWVVTIAVLLIIAGISIAMIFGGDEGTSSNIQNQNTNNTVQTVTNS